MQMRRNLKLTAVLPDANSVISFFRGGYPLKEMALRFDVELTIIDLKRTQSIGWCDIAGTDILYMQGPNTKLHHSIFDMAKKMGIITWIDYDDNVLDVPLYHRKHEHYKAVSGYIMDMVRQSNWVTVSTEYLKGVFSQLRNDYIEEHEIMVIANAVPDVFSPKVRQDTLLPTNTIYWRGGDHHAEDFMGVAYELAEWLMNNPTYMLMCAGAVPWYVKEDFFPQERVVIKESQPILDYLDFLRYNTADVCVIALQDNAFNHASSVNNWIEATMLGAAVVKPSTAPQYKTLPGVSYGGDGADDLLLGEAITEAIERREEIVGDADNILHVVNNFERSLHARYSILMRGK